jgi:hypothetical protein
MGAATGAIMKAINSDQQAAEAFAKSTATGPFSLAPAQRPPAAKAATREPGK